MSATPRPTIPYEKQVDLQTNRMCGAAALSMVYRSFGKAIAQPEVWQKIAKHNRLGSLAASTHLIAQDALNRGFAALVIQAKHPLQVLRLCLDNGIRAILNHRLKEDASTGHFTVLVDLDGDHVVLHDPYLGPSRRVAQTELLELWRPRYLNAEIAGNVLIGIAAQPGAVAPCSLCGTKTPPSIHCPKCGKPVPLQPAALLGCMGASCAARLWNYLWCPFCDHGWSFSLEAAGAKVGSGSEEPSVDLNPLFAELDKFCEHILSLGEVASHPDVRKQLDFLRASKDKLKLAQTEELVCRKGNEAQMTQLQQKFKQEEEAILKKREEINKPGPALDGDALGQALVKDLGLLRDGVASKKPAAPLAASVPPPTSPVAAQERKPVAEEEPASDRDWDTLDIHEENRR